MWHPESDSDDPIMRAQIQKLHELTVYSRWTIVAVLWAIVAPLSLWEMRSDIALLTDYFTWATVRYSLFHNRLAAIGLGLCLGMTASTLLWQSRNILIGFPSRYRKRLEKQVLRIRRQGQNHPLWRWVVGE